jgi:hypothetical protein
MKKTILAFSCAALLLSGCLGGPSASSGVMQAPESKGGFMGLSKADDVKVMTPKAFAGVDRVVIGNFVVGFATYKTASAKAGGGLTGNGFGGKSTAKSALTGVDDATMQRITDAAYADFVASLEKQGYKIMDRAQLMNYADFKSTTSYPSPMEDSKGGIFGGKSVTKYFAPTSLGAIRSFADVPGYMGGFGFGNPMTGAAKFGKETGIKVISAVYVLDFANADAYGGWARSSSSITVGQGLTVVPDYTKISIIGGDAGTFSTANGSLTLGQPVMSDKTFAQVSDATSGAAKGVEVATNIVGILGGIGSNSSREYTFAANPADYQAGSVEALQKANQAFIGKAVALR